MHSRSLCSSIRLVAASTASQRLTLVHGCCYTLRAQATADSAMSEFGAHDCCRWLDDSARSCDSHTQPVENGRDASALAPFAD